jgi:pyruvate dehydrogenase E1 component
MTRGFLIGATAGRTTLNGEGLQHEDGQSHLIAATNPAVVAYDPAFAFEIGHIVRDGLRRMYGEDSENVYYYLTMYNEPINQPPAPEGLDVDGLLRGLYRYRPASTSHDLRAQVLASGSIMPAALRAQELLADDWGVSADVWSVTSWVELHRDGLRTDDANLLDPASEPQQAFVTRSLTEVPGPVVAVSDYQRAVQELIRPWVPGDYATLGTDGFGLSDTRGALRRHFRVDAEAITVRTLSELARRGEVKREQVKEAFDRYQLDDPRAADPGAGMGDA